MTLAAILLLVVIAWPAFAELRYGSGSGIGDRGLTSQFDAETGDRVGPWLEGVEVFLSAPLFGVGYARLIEETSISAHNWYVKVAAETGIAGLALWTLFILAVVLALRRRPRPARTVGYSALAAWMVASLFLDVPNFYQVTGPLLITLAVALSADWAPHDREVVVATNGAPLARTGPARARGLAR